MKRLAVSVVLFSLGLYPQASGQSGIIATVAGAGTQGFSGDGGPATSASLFLAYGVAVDASGNLFIADTSNNRVRKVSASGVIVTVAGNGTAGFSGDGGPATSASLNSPWSVVMDPSGNLFIADAKNSRIRKVSASGVIMTVAGKGAAGFSGDGGPATSASLNQPEGVAVDAAGNLFIADTNNFRVRKVSASGVITTVAGNGYTGQGYGGYSGDNGLATSAELSLPAGVAVDTYGNLFIADSVNARIRKVSANGIITLVAGNLSPSFSGDGGPATSAGLWSPRAVVVDAYGNLFIADCGNSRIRKVSASSGIITTVAGNGTQGFSGDGGLGPSAELFLPAGIAMDASGNLFIADTYNNRVRELLALPSSTPVLTVSPPNLSFSLIAGGSSTKQISLAGSVPGVAWGASASAGWIALTPSSGITPAALNVAIDAASLQPGAYTASITIQAPGATPSSTTVSVALTVTGPSGQGGTIATVAGDGGYEPTIDGGPATSTTLSPLRVAVDSSGNLFIADTGHNRIRKVSPNGIVTTVAGNGSGGYYGGFSGDGGPATSAELATPLGVAVDGSGNLFIADTGNNRIRMVSAGGIITTVAGNGPSCGTGGVCGGFSGDGGPATSAALNDPTVVAVDVSGNLLIADTANNRIRKVSASGVITTVAGNGAVGNKNGNFSGDGGPATSALLSGPTGLAVDGSGNLFIADTGNERIRKVSASGNITTVAGNGVSGISYGGFGGAGTGVIGGPATSGALSGPGGIAVDGSGNLFIADYFYNQILKVSASGTITIFAGNGLTNSNFSGAFSGDGGPATSAGLNNPQGVVVDVSGNVFIADTSNGRIREVFAQAPSFTVLPANITLSLMPGTSSIQQIGVVIPAAGLAWSASTSASWIKLSPASGTTPGTVAVAINTASLQPGNYTATITIAIPVASPPTETVKVSLTVAAPTATISVAPASLRFQIWQGAAAETQSLQLDGTAGTAWQATAATSTGGAWLSVSQATGQIPAALTALVNWGSLAVGTYQGSITVQAPADPSSITIGVTLTVVAGNGIITTVAGNGKSGFTGDGGPAVSATFNFLDYAPGAVAVDGSGNLLIADSGNSRIRKVSAANGIITTIAGGGTGGLGDGGPATAAKLNGPLGLAMDASGNLFIADDGNNRIRKISAASGIIITVAGNGNTGFSGDGGPATSAGLNDPQGVAVDGSGDVFIADTGNNRIRKVSASGIITTVAGGGSPASGLGDGGPATAVALNGPEGIAVDASRNLFISDTGNSRIREVSADGIITTFESTVSDPAGLALDTSGNLFISDADDNQILELSASGIITRVAGSGNGFYFGGFAGDGGPATSASLNFPSSVTVDAAGNLFIVDSQNERIRKVSARPTSTALPSINFGGVVPVYSAATTIQPGEWVSIYGSSLASSTVTWNGTFPTSLGGTSVTIDGKAGYLWFVSPTQINLQAPNDTATGPVPVVVTTVNGTFTSTVTLGVIAPAFLLRDSKYVTGIILRPDGSGAYGGGAYDILGPTGNSLGYPTVAATAGDIVELFGTGFGPTNPAVPAGQVFSGAAQTTFPVNLLIGNTNVTPMFAGLSGAGLDQINLTVPAGLSTGDVSLQASVGGVQTPSGVVIPLQ